MTEEIEGAAPNPFDDWTVDYRTMAVLLKAAGWDWDYWGKFYGPGGIKVRDPRCVLEHIKSNAPDPFADLHGDSW